MADNGIYQDGCWSRGFDQSPANGSAYWTLTAAGTGGNASSSTPFSFGFSWINNSSNGMAFNTNLTSHTQGIRFLLTAMPSTSGIMFQWHDVTANAAQVTLRIFNDGHFQFFLGNGTGTPIGSASAAGLAGIGVWCQAEMKVVINGSTGMVELKVNGTVVITASSVNTKSTANTWVSGMLIQPPTGNNISWDDWYMLDMTGSAPLNDYLGPVQCRGEKSNANSAVGGRNAWTPTNPQNDNHLNVGNIPANAAQYNADQTPGDYDMFRFPSLPSGSTVFFLNLQAFLGLDSAGARTVKLNCYSGGTDHAGPAVTPPAIASASYINRVFTVDPNTSSPWGLSAAGSAELGVKVET